MRKEHKFWGITALASILLASLTMVSCTDSIRHIPLVIDGSDRLATTIYCDYSLSCGFCTIRDTCGKFQVGDTLRYTK
jgi:hypothetical protein